MKATLIVIQNDADHAEAKRLIERLMDSNDPADQARIAIQARLVEPTSARGGRTEIPRYRNS